MPVSDQISTTKHDPGPPPTLAPQVPFPPGLPPASTCPAHHPSPLPALTCPFTHMHLPFPAPAHPSASALFPIPTPVCPSFSLPMLGTHFGTHLNGPLLAHPCLKELQIHIYFRYIVHGCILMPDFEPCARLPPAYLSLTCHTVSSILYLTFHL
jgi:hypothetical protein